MSNIQSLPKPQAVNKQLSVEQWRGPLPRPEDLEKFEKIHPGSAKIIFDQFVKQSDHRMKQENNIINGNLKLEKRGQLSGTLIMLTVIVGGFYLIYLGYNITGFITSMAAFISQMAMFYTKRKDEKELAKQGSENN